MRIFFSETIINIFSVTHVFDVANTVSFFFFIIVLFHMFRFDLELCVAHFDE